MLRTSSEEGGGANQAITVINKICLKLRRTGGLLTGLLQVQSSRVCLSVDVWCSNDKQL